MTPEREKDIHAKIRRVFTENGGRMTLDQCTRLVLQAEILTRTEMRDGARAVLAAAAARAASRLGMSAPDFLHAAFVDRDEAVCAVLREEIERHGEDEP